MSENYTIGDGIETIRVKKLSAHNIHKNQKETLFSWIDSELVAPDYNKLELKSRLDELFGELKSRIDIFYTHFEKYFRIHHDLDFAVQLLAIDLTEKQDLHACDKGIDINPNTLKNRVAKNETLIKKDIKNYLSACLEVS